MQLIISSEIFSSIVIHILKGNHSDFVIDKSRKSINFTKGMQQTMYVHIDAADFSKKDEPELFRAKFHLLTWLRLFHFLTTLEDQPVVVDFARVGSDGVNITCSMVSITFDNNI